jgi:hypothetical protein
VIPWLMIEFGFCGTWAFFYLTTSIDTAVKCADYDASVSKFLHFLLFYATCLIEMDTKNVNFFQSFGAASFFGFIATAVYGYDAFIKFQASRNISGHD